MQLATRQQSSSSRGRAFIRKKTYGLEEPKEEAQCYGAIISKGHKTI